MAQELEYNGPQKWLPSLKNKTAITPENQWLESMHFPLGQAWPILRGLWPAVSFRDPLESLVDHFFFENTLGRL